MHLDDLLPRFQQAMLFNRPPKMILVHVGGNDLVQFKVTRIIKDLKRHLSYIASVFPEALVIWSDILPRTHWRGAINTPENLRKLDNKRKRINRAGRLVTKELPHGRSIRHSIDTTPGLLKEDGVHLTLIGNAIFLDTLQEALHTFTTDPMQTVYDPNSN